jgi:hypothetical protein
VADDAADLDPIPLTAIDAFSSRASLDAWATVGPADDTGVTVPRPLTVGRRPLLSPGSRAPRRAADTASLDAGQRSNWLLTGPRNIVGRTRALAIHPANSSVMYAGLASGGVWKTTDRGESWAPAWREDASQSIGAIDICRDHPATVWVATGEHLSQILGNGIYVSTDDGATWGPNNAVVPDGGKAVTFDAVAAHPTDAQRCWAVGVTGVYRTADGGLTWETLVSGTYYSDVAFAAGPAGLVIFLVRAVSVQGEATVLRIDNPDDTLANVVASIGNAANASNPIPAGPPPALPAPLPTWPGRGKIAICAGTPTVAYVRFVLQGNDGNGGGHAGLFRTQAAPHDARAASGSAIQWDTIAGAAHADFAVESGQRTGGYSMALAVNPTNAAEIAVGLLNVLTSQNATAAAPAFKRVMAQELNPVVDPVQHADIHRLIFGPPVVGSPPGTPATLWVANDGGIARSDDWSTGAGYDQLGFSFFPLPDGAVSWTKSYGISGSQMYSLAQSPLLPTAFGCGFQDNGALMTEGGPTWRHLISGDGGFIAFDPVDPYTLLATWQREIDEVVFPGRLEGAFPPPGTSAGTGLWPRFLAQGFLPGDPPLFVADTAHHALHGDRVLTARQNRLYGTTGAAGDRWQVEPAGRSFDLQVAVPANTLAILRVRTTSTAGAALGLPPQVRAVFTQAAPTVLQLFSLLPAPYAVQAGQHLDLQLTMQPLAPFGPPVNVPVPPVVFGAGPLTAVQAAAAIRGATGGVAGFTSNPCFWGRPNTVEVTATAAGAGITLGGTALQGGASPLGHRPRTVNPTPNRAATVSIAAPNVGVDAASTMSGRAGQTLTLAVGGGAAKTVTFDAGTFADLDWIHAGELANAIRAALDGAPATVLAHSALKVLVFLDTGGAGLTLAGTAATAYPASGLPGHGLNFAGGQSPPAPNRLLLLAFPGPGNTFDLSRIGGVPQTLTINDGAARPTLTFNGADADLAAITAEELQTLIQNHFTANGVTGTCDVEYLANVGFPSEIVYSTAAPDTAWAGSTDGTLYRTTNDRDWEVVADPQVGAFDRSVEAIAIHPANADVVYVGLEGRPTAGPEDNTPLTKPGLLFKTTDAGRTWSHVGADVKSTDGGLLGVYALRIDTGAPDTVFAATEVGVFRTTDGGSHWSPFNEGLPPGLVRDLDFVPERRVLRAGIWGRGTYERRVGDASPKDVQLYVRTNLLDDGTIRPTPRGPDLRATHPRTLPATESPDIKVSRDIPPSLRGLITLDGAAFDLDVEHEDVVAGNSAVYVQLHNRGGFTGTSLRVVCMWADASAGVPPLPDDFWTTFHAGAVAASAGAWTLVHDSLRPDAVAVVAEIAPGRPVVQRLPVTWPNDVATRRRIGILLLVESAEDQLTATATALDELLAAETKAAYRETGTVSERDDQTIFLQRTRAAQFTVAAAPPLPAATSLFTGGVLPAGLQNDVVGATQPVYNLPLVAGNVQALTVSTPAQVLTITFDAAAGIVNAAAVTQAQLMNALTRAIAAAGAPLAVNAGVGGRVQLRGGAGSVFAVTGGTAAAGLNFAGTPSVLTSAAPAGPGLTFNMSAGAPQTLTLSITNRAVVHFSHQPDFDPAAPEPARAVRRVLNRAFGAANLPVRAVVPRVDLWIRRSITDIDGLPSPVAGRGLADLVASAVAVAPPRDGLFDLVHVHGPDPVHASVDNFLYLRVSNLGTNQLVAGDSRHRLFSVAIGASPITLTQLGAPAGVQQAVPAGGSTIVEVRWNPGAVAVGDRLFLLAVSDDQNHAPLQKDGAAFDATSTFADVDALDRFCSANPSVAYRMFVVGA